MAIEEWDLWYPKAAATGISFARGRCDHTAVMLVHAAPPILSVKVTSKEGQLIAKSDDLKSTDDTPVTRLTIQGTAIQREDIWPTDQDLGLLIILPVGEIGTL